MQEVKILRPTECSVICLTLDGSSISPFLWVNLVQALFHSGIIKPEDQKILIKSVKQERRYGQRLKHFTEILPNGDGKQAVFICRIIQVIL